MDVLPAKFYAHANAGSNGNCLRHRQSYGSRVGNPFALTNKFSGKTASTHRQIIDKNKKGDR
jgi:hypothetical protein